MEAEQQKKRKFRYKDIVLLLLNGIGVALILVLLCLYRADNQRHMLDRSLNDAANLNRAAAKMSRSLFDNQQSRLLDAAQYISRRAMTRREAMDYLFDTNADNGVTYELIDADATGYLISLGEDDGYIPVSYANSSYAALKRIFAAAGPEKAGTADFTPEFTDSHTSFKSFALYTGVPVRETDGTVAWCTLLSVCRTSYFLDAICVPESYVDISTVLIDAKGSYILSSPDFKSDNFFQYLYVFNNLSLDQKNSILQEVVRQGTGNLQYNDSRGRPCVFAYTHIDGSEWYTVTVIPLSSFSTDNSDYRFTLLTVLILALTMVMDVVWLRLMNVRLLRSMEREKEANSAKTDFLARMSHDIRTPLNGILGMAYLAKEEANPPATQDALDNIEMSGRFLLGLVNDILDMNRVESGRMELHPEPYRYAELKDYLHAVIQPQCEAHGLSFTVEDPGMAAPMYFDRLRLNQIFFNLLSNAVKFTPEGGKIELCCRAAPLEGERLGLDFTVRDNGIGMSEEFQKHMFEAFSQESRTEARGQAGSGLGLAIVYRLVELMGGTVRVESSLGAGTAFYVHLETHLLTDSAPSPKSETCDDLDLLAGRHILLCEDHDLNAQIAMRLLEKKGMLPDRAENGEVGVERFAASTPGYYAAVLMDVRMPVMDGLAASRNIRALPRADAAQVPILAMTANAYDSDVQNCLAAGMNAHLAKPIDPAALYHKLLAEITAAEKTAR